VVGDDVAVASASMLPAMRPLALSAGERTRRSGEPNTYEELICSFGRFPERRAANAEHAIRHNCRRVASEKLSIAEVGYAHPSSA